MKKITLLAVSTLLLLTACGQVESDPPEIAPPATVIQEQPQEQKAPQAETVPRATQNLEPVEEPTEDIPSETVHAKTGYVEPEPEPTPEPTVPADRQVAIDAANAAAGEVKIYDIGQPADILGQNECIICSQVTDNSAMIVASMQAVIDGTFGGATLYGTLQNNTLSAGALSDLVPADVQEKYLAYIDQMIAGTFMQ